MDDIYDMQEDHPKEYSLDWPRSLESLWDLASGLSCGLACNSCRSSKAFRSCSWHGPKAPVSRVCQSVLKNVENDCDLI